MIFYHRGEFFSRDNIHPGMLTLHPKALETGSKALRKVTDEVAVMIDTRDALEVGELPGGVEWTGYVDSWKGGKP